MRSLHYASAPLHTHSAPAVEENPFAALLSKPLVAAPAPAPEASLFSELLGKPLVSPQVAVPAPAPCAPASKPRTKSAPKRPDRMIRICGCGDPTCLRGGTDRGWMYLRAR